MSATTIQVRGPAPYDVQVGPGLLARVPEWLVNQPAQPHRVALIVDEALPAIAGIAERLVHLTDRLAAHYEVQTILLPSGESAKDVGAVARAWEQLGAAGFTRSDWVITCGGGAVTDVGGFIAATWLRGVPVVHLPTTVLAMVDAAVGGKTGMNTAAGKNLVGAFHEPRAVFCDLDLVASLPVAELASGLAEAIKCGFIADPVILDRVEQLGPLEAAAENPILRDIVERAIVVKAEVVSQDLREIGGMAGHPGREALNYGHTLAHAIERAEDYRMRHGEAVAIGCVFVAEVAHRCGLIDDALLARHRTAFASVGLPVAYDRAGWKQLRATMAVDKKSRGATLRLVVLHALAAPRVLSGPDEDVLRAAAEAIGVAR